MVDYTYYSSSASKGFTFLIPYHVQANFVSLTKKLPPTARPVYREYFGDIMACRDRARDSAEAMQTFVNESFPRISKDHNRLANLMNAEIDKQRKEVSVKIPITGDGTAAEDDEDDKPVTQSREGKQNVATPGKNVTSEAVSEAAAEATVREDSPEAAPPLTMANTKLVRPTLRQGPAASSASPTGINSEQSEADEEDSELSVIFVDTSEPWNDSLWPHGTWIDGLEVIDALPWAHPSRPERIAPDAQSPHDEPQHAAANPHSS
ncbi:uncharacterized protein J4E84_009774 [Alternaria hordeiaustralica]|uniref:uncharacterized protein n=1 Tax=Alternaria hordeiaustralica TaxID=1187925 RepID=UPI0020C249B2|nr:uncharacterized protein J4E84_009774 [Alternaria hordeiaustralica]KAI4675975.1 hypothetical protein J4E84_009774 [Alternaria hordeiaustralica]